MKEKAIKNPLLIDTIQRYLLFIIGLFFSALGVAITKKGELGVSPISSVANVMSIRLPQLSLGYWLIIWNCVLILGQILLLRRKFQWIQLLQVPLSFLFGWFTDFGVWLISFSRRNITSYRFYWCWQEQSCLDSALRWQSLQM